MIVPMGWIYDFDTPPPGTAEERTRLLGGKGANLVVMASELGLPVPPGFTITTDACRYYLAGAWPEGLDEELREHLDRLGERVGRRFGDPADPLLVSVRSGAPVSMPGMMDTLLDLGLTSATLDGLARAAGDSAFAADCRRRLGEGWHAVIGPGMVPDDPWAQLRAAVAAVFGSWNSERARAYRRVEGIADDLGTAVTIQAMVFGNRGPNSGTGVLFTRNPSTGERVLYGDFMFNAQGEDVVAGAQATEPLAVLDERLPAVAAELRRHCRVLEQHLADLADVEFTVDDGRLWLLQVRVGKRSPRAALRMAIDMAEDADFPLSRAEAVRRVAALLASPPQVFTAAGQAPPPIAVGLPASPGVAAGAIALTSAAAEEAAESGLTVILVRSETSPEDVRGMARAAGVLTARGGLASHAAVVARGWGIPAVVGATDIAPTDDQLTIAGRRFEAGAVITIDGSTGYVYDGALAGHWALAPEAATLLGWAAELGIEVGRAEQATAPATPAADSTDELLRSLAIKGQASPNSIGNSLDALVQAGLAEVSADSAHLTPAGKQAAAQLFATDAAAIGAPRGLELLEQFHTLDERLKTIVTAWQLRATAGTQVLNDHTDAAYDAAVLDELAALHEDAVGWLAALTAVGQRFAAYRERLGLAVEQARSGDQRYVASPRVESYHSVWFELHEDLIRSTGRDRAEEVAAGRA
jgi:pyruvate,orthophosphate dikinase